MHNFNEIKKDLLASTAGKEVISQYCNCLWLVYFYKKGAYTLIKLIDGVLNIIN